MHPLRPAFRLASVVLLALVALPTAQSLASPLGQAPTASRCQWIGRATKPPERLGPTQFLLTLAIDLDLGPAQAMTGSEATVIVNSTYGTSFYRPFDIKTGTTLEVAGYVRTGGQCVVDSLNVGTLAPGEEGYLRPPNACPTAGDETIAIAERATIPLGCAVAPMFTAPTALQRYEHGVMLSLRGIYALRYAPAALRGRPIDGGVWSGTRNTWREPEPREVGMEPPPGLFEAKLGFGKAWREQFGGPDGPFGWATEDEVTGDASWQQFERGIVVVTRAGEGLILYHENRIWEYKVR